MAELPKDLYEGAFSETNGVDEDAHIVPKCKNCGNMPQGRGPRREKIASVR